MFVPVKGQRYRLRFEQPAHTADIPIPLSAGVPRGVSLIAAKPAYSSEVHSLHF